jgi:thiol-disulfide isomerase/thioredoxin
MGGVPAGVADEKTTRELALLSKVAAYEGFNGKEDPALLKLGEVLVRFIRERDTAILEKEALMNSDLAWAQIQKAGRSGGPSRKELDEEISEQVREQVERARMVLKQMDDAGVDLKNAEVQIEDASIKRAQAQGSPGSLDGLMGEQFKLTFAVKADGRSKNGTPLSGRYVLAVNELTRFADDWRVMKDVRWYQMPAGVVDEKAVAAMQFEDYVAENRALPPGTTVPEIEFTTLEGEKNMKLSDLRGKVVVLDFWATWCGPCQEPMAKLQPLRKEHTDWKDRVAIVPLSIDDTIDIVRKHVNKRGWTNTFNAWAGDGGWRSKPATTFRVSGVPTTYIIDAQGKIVRAGHPAGMQIGQEVDALLKVQN